MNSEYAKILVADDDPTQRSLLLTLIQKKFHCETLEAADGLDTLRIILQEVPDLDLVILDMKMPLVDGLDILSIIKKNRDLRELHVIACTARNAQDEVEEICRRGVSDFIVKPVTKHILYPKIQHALRRLGKLS